MPDELGVLRPRDALQEAIATLLDDIDGLAREIVSAYRTAIPQYAAVQDLSLLRDMRDAAAEHATILLGCLAADRAVSAAELERMAMLGRDRATHGIDLHALIDAYLVGERVTLDRLTPEIARIRARRGLEPPDIAPLRAQTRRLVTQAIEAICRAYLDFARTSGIEHEQAWRQGIEQLLEGAFVSPDAAEAVAQDLGLGPGATHTVAAFDIVGPPGWGGPEAVSRFKTVSDALALHLAPLMRAQPIVGLRGGLTVILTSARERDSHRAVAGAVARAVDRNAACIRTVAGIGGAEKGAQGLQRSYRQAVAVTELLMSAPSLGPVMSYDDALPYLHLRSDPLYATELIRLGVGPLARHDAELGTDLLSIVDACIECRGNRSEAARRLHMHRDTLTGRVRLIEELTGRRLDDRRDLRLLEFGLVALALTPVQT